MSAPAIVWLRQDLRLTDNPALSAAASQGRPVLPLFLLDDEGADAWSYGGAARWWLHHSLAALSADLAARGAPLHFAHGRAESVVPALAASIGASEVHAARLYEPQARARDARVEEALAGPGARLRLHGATLLREPGTVLSAGAGRPYMVYAPFAKTVLAGGDPPEPLPAPERLVPVPQTPSPGSGHLDSLALLPRPPVPDWAAEFPSHWTPGEIGAQVRLARFLARPLGGYATTRNDPGIEGSSALSPHLRWGEISPRQVWHTTLAAAGSGGRAAAEPFLRELIWRDFHYHLLWHRTDMPERALRPDFAAFPFEPDRRLLRAWQRGRTGYPIVDAGMRQLWRIGWMHNRVRMIAASLLVKHLLQPWQDGEAWFWDTLVDADLANNSASWQWIAGTGVEAAPYFRVFNPTLQGEKFDPTGAYVRRWVPELAPLPDRYLHRPWEAPAAVLAAAGVELGRDYPRPVIDHAAGRARALDAFRRLRQSSGGEAAEATEAA